MTIAHDPAAFVRNSAVCHGCASRRGSHCMADGVDFMSHANAGYCPSRFFTENAPHPEGWDQLPRQEFPAAPLTCEKMVRGIVGQTKSRLHVGRAADSVIARRLNVCGKCPHAMFTGGQLQTCRLCRCTLAVKVTLAQEHCPEFRWTKTGQSVAVVQLGRHGDIMGVLPLMRRLSREQIVRHVVCPEFAGLVDGLSYLTPHVYNGANNGVAGAIAVARDIADEVIASQRNGNPLKPPTADNFFAEPWTRAGMLDSFESLPLVLDNRDADRERALCQRLIGDDRRPLLLVNTAACSAKYADAAALVQWVKDRWGERHNVLDLTHVRAERLQDLLGVYERAQAMLSVDTATLHLTYACRLPVVGLVNNDPYLAPPRRPHWIERMTYDESRTESGRERIAVALDARLAQPRSLPHILHVVDDSWRPDPATDDFRRLANAADTWAGLPGWTTCRFRHPARTSADIGDTRTLPYIRDIFDWACTLASGDDLVCFTNSDIKITPEAPDALRAKLRDYDCCFARRVEVGDDQPRTGELLRHSPPYLGYDLFAFRPSWWARVRDSFPDMLLACEGWDCVMRFLMGRESTVQEIQPTVIYHRAHRPFWCSGTNQTQNAGNAYNRMVGRKWAQEHGYENRLEPRGPKGGCVFQAIRIGVLSLCTPEYAAIESVTGPVRRAYCQRHGYTELRLDHAIDPRPASWSKIPFLLQNLSAFDWILWMDADALVTNPAVKVETLLPTEDRDAIFPFDCPQTPINAGMFLIRNSPGSRRFLEAVLACTKWGSNWEQDAMLDVLANGGDWKIGFTDPRKFNCFPSVWRPGDFILHATRDIVRTAEAKVGVLRRILQEPTRSWIEYSSPIWAPA